MAKDVAEGPDRGWSWVIAFAACFNSLVLAGIFRTSGVLFVAFIDEFGVTREEASWPVVLCVSVLNLTGIITGPLGQRFGVRPIVILGTIVATVGISSCYFTTSFSTITFLFGVVYAVGHGLASTLMPIIVNEYFLNHRATANGIANSGSCFGSILFPLLFECFIDSYGLPGCFLLTGGIVLQLAIPAALMRPPAWLNVHKSVAKTKMRDKNSNPKYVTQKLNSYRELSGYNAVIKSIENRNSKQKCKEENESWPCRIIEKNIKKSKGEDGCSFRNTEDQWYSGDSEPKEENVVTNGKETFRNSLLGNEEDVLHQKQEAELHKSIKELKECFVTFEKVWKSSVQCFSEYKPFISIDIANTENLSFKSDSELPFNEQSANLKLYNGTKITPTLQESNSATAVKQDYSRHFVQNQNTKIRKLESFRNVLEDENCISNASIASDVGKITFEMQQETESTPEIEQSKFSKQPITIVKSFRKVLTSPMFYVITMTNVSFYFLYHMYVVIIVDFSLDKGTPGKDTKYVLFGFAISDLAGRLCFGWITDRNFLRRSHFVMGSMILIGLNFLGFPFVNDSVWLVFVSCLYGLLLGCTMVVFPILLVDYLGMEIQAVAMGCMCFLNGLASLTRPFIIGYFRDNVGSYSNIFFILGGISLTASILWLLEKCLVKTENK